MFAFHPELLYCALIFIVFACCLFFLCHNDVYVCVCFLFCFSLFFVVVDPAGGLFLTTRKGITSVVLYDRSPDGSLLPRDMNLSTQGGNNATINTEFGWIYYSMAVRQSRKSGFSCGDT